MLPDLQITERTEAVRCGGMGCSNFRLMAKAILLDPGVEGPQALLSGPGAPILEDVEPAVSTKFIVSAECGGWRAGG